MREKNKEIKSRRTKTVGRKKPTVISRRKLKSGKGRKQWRYYS